MDKEKMNVTELNDKELEQVSGGHICPGPGPGNVCFMKGKYDKCASCSAIANNNQAI